MRLLVLLALVAAATSVAASASGDLHDPAAHPRKILLLTGTLDTESIPSLAAAGPAVLSDESHGLFLVQTRESVTEDDLRAISAALDAPVKDYLPHHAFVVHTTARRAAAAVSDPALRGAVVWAGRFEPQHRLSPELEHFLAAAPRPGGRASRSAKTVAEHLEARKRAKAATEVVSLVVDLAESPRLVAAEVAARWRARPGLESLRAIDRRRLELRMDAAEAAASGMELARWLSEQPECAYVSPQRRFYALNYYARHLTQDNQLADEGTDNLNTSFSLAGLTGEGVLVGCADTGVHVSSCYFSDAETAVPFDRLNMNHRKIVYYDTYVDNSDGDGHGTHVAGSILGDRAAGSDVHTGMARDAKLWFTDMGDDSGALDVPSLDDLLLKPYDDGVRIHSDSWGYSSGAQELAYSINIYTSFERAVDSLLHEEDDLLVLFAAGNDGDRALTSTVGAPSTAKNSLSIGASSNTEASWSEADGSSGAYFSEQSMASFSGTGPARDGRRKPDLVAPGHQILSAATGESCGTVYLSGTSMATPVAAGSAAVVQQYLRSGFNDQFAAGSSRPKSALMKALLVNGAVTVGRRQYTRPDTDGGEYAPTPHNASAEAAVGPGGSIELPHGRTYYTVVDSSECKLFHVTLPEGTATARVTVVTFDDPVDLYAARVSTLPDDATLSDLSGSDARSLELDGSPAGWFFCVAAGAAGAEVVVQVVAYESTSNYVLASDAECELLGAQLPHIVDANGAGAFSSVFVRCPADCPSDAPVYGTDEYSDLSSVCRAALHAGVISPTSGDQLVGFSGRLGAADGGYSGSRGFHGVTSQSLTETDFFSFTLVTGGPADAEDGNPSLGGTDPPLKAANHVGFGRVALINSIPLESHPTELVILSNATAASQLVEKDDELEWCFDAVTTSSSNLMSVTLAWNDPAPALGASRQLVNNLDLEVLLDGATYYGNDDAETGARDRLNNVERVIMSEVPVGRHCVRVVATSLPKPPQPFALVMTLTRGQLDNLTSPDLGDRGDFDASASALNSSPAGWLMAVLLSALCAVLLA